MKKITSSRSSVMQSLLVMVALVSSSRVLAQGITNPITPDNLWEFLGKIITSITYILFPILVLMLIYTGYLFVVAQGNPGKLQEAKNAFIWTLVGAFVVLGAQALSLAIKATVDSLG